MSEEFNEAPRSEKPTANQTTGSGDENADSNSFTQAEYKQNDAVHRNDNTGNPDHQIKTLNHTRRVWEFIKKPEHSNAMIALFTLILVAANIAYTSFAFLQWKTMNETLKEMQRSGDSSGDQAFRVIDNMNWLARTMDDSMKAASISATTSKEQSKRALDAAIAASRTDLRAWISVSAVDFNPGVAKGVRHHITVETVNSGKTPARQVTLFKTGFGATPSEADPREVPHSSISAIGIPPGIKIISYVADDGKTERLIESLTDGGDGFYVRGIFKYQDVFGRTHKTGFCAFYEGSGRPFIGCEPQYNYTE